MKTSTFTLVLLALTVCTACKARNGDDSPVATDAAPAAAAAANDPAPSTAIVADAAPDAATPTQDDALALGLLASVNDHEIKAADQAMSKNVKGPVLEYAQMMKTQHTENQTKTMALGARDDAPEVQDRKEKGAAELTQLDKLSGTAYEKAYAQAMVKGHTEALALIDERLLPMASAGPVKDHLTMTRGHVAMHLDAAKKL
jgi:putative membrane protein